MWNKTGKFIIVTIMLVALLFTSVPGIALADDEGNNVPGSAFLELVAESLGLTPEQLRDIYREARESMDPDNPDREAFKAKVEELLNDQYDIPLGTLQTEQWPGRIFSAWNVTTPVDCVFAYDRSVKLFDRLALTAKPV